MTKSKWGAGLLGASLLLVSGCGTTLEQETVAQAEFAETVTSVEKEVSERISEETGLTFGTHEILINGAALGDSYEKIIAGRDGYLKETSDYTQDLYFEENASVALQIRKEVEELELTLPANDENQNLYEAYNELFEEVSNASDLYYEMATSENDEVYLGLLNDSMKKVNVLHEQFRSELDFVRQKLN